ncbi:hypothetical protein HWV62_23827 [Athelia sp. TMB]|nr:hypothetical protein HWV62_23827 [Athelia sp. TMB]
MRTDHDLGQALFGHRRVQGGRALLPPTFMASRTPTQSTQPMSSPLHPSSSQPSARVHRLPESPFQRRSHHPNDTAQTLSTRIRDLEDREQDLEERLSELQFRESSVERRENHVASQARRLQDRTSELRRREESINQREEAVRYRELQVEAYDEWVTIHEFEVEERALTQDEHITNRSPRSSGNNQSETMVNTLSQLSLNTNASASSASTSTISSESTLSAHTPPRTPPPESQDNRSYVVNSPARQGEVRTTGQPHRK